MSTDKLYKPKNAPTPPKTRKAKEQKIEKVKDPPVKEIKKVDPPKPKKEKPQKVKEAKKPKEKKPPKVKPVKQKEKADASVQNYLPIYRLYEGMIVTTDHKFIGVLEVNGCDFIKEIYKDDVMDRFGAMFNSPSVKISIKVLSNLPNPKSQINELSKRSEREFDEIRHDVTKKTLDISSSGTFEKRYFVIFEYLGDSKGVKSKDEETIASSMKVSRLTLTTQLSDMGVEVINKVPDNYFLAEFLYSFFNRRSSVNVDFETRKKVVDINTKVFNKALGNDVPVRIADYIAPKGLDFSNKDYLVIDGLYETFLTLKTDSWPELAKGPWLSQFDRFGAYVDLDIITKALPKETIRYVLTKRNQILNQIMLVNSTSVKMGAEDKQKKMALNYQNTKVITDALENGENIYNVLLVITIKALTKKELFEKRAQIKQFLVSSLNGIKAADSYLENEEFFRQIMPIGYTSRIFNRYAHNLTTEGISSLFPFTQHSLNDRNGVVLGYLSNYGSIASIDVFNTKKYSNANLAIFGSPGGGKTFTQLLFAESLFLQGKRLWFILPKKGYEYKKSAERLNGNYIYLSPGSSSCINICAITPREIDPKKSAECLRADKVTSLTVFINLLLGEKERLSTDENTLLVTHLARFYEKFDITEDNDSIYEDKENKILRPMPTLGDLFAYMYQVTELKRVSNLLKMFVTGNYSSLNGQTNVDTSSGYVVFDINEELIPEMHLAAFLYIAFDYVTTKVKESLKTKDVLIMDEYWKMLKSSECAKQIQDCLKIFRGYGGSVILATQELNDCLSSDEGKSVLNNTSMKICLKTEPTQIDLVKQATGISDIEAKKLVTLFHQGMFITSKERTLIDIVASKDELKAFNTDVSLNL